MELAQQNIEKFVYHAEVQHLFVLPILEVPLKQMTESELRRFVPNMLMYSMGSDEWDLKYASKPTWWPNDVQWANIWTDEKLDTSIQMTNDKTAALQKVVISCYKYHGREDLLSITDEMEVHKCDLLDNRNPLRVLDRTIEIKTICRLCLSNATSAAVDIFSFYNDEEIASIVSQHFWLKIFKGDGQSDRLCSHCWVKIEGFHKFYKEVQQIHNYLPETFAKAQQIKEEPEESITDIACESEMEQQISNINDFYEVTSVDVGPLTPEDGKYSETVDENQILENCEDTLSETLPEKSYKKYKNVYEIFVKWQKSKELISFAEPVLLAYFNELAMKYKPSSMWSMYSMLKSTLLYNNEIDISQYHRLLAFLKNKANGFQSIKSKLFTEEEINTFLAEAPDSKYLAMKTVLVFGVIGAFRGGEEITNVKADHVKDNGNQIIVSIPEKKTKVAKDYIIDGQFAEIVRKYMKTRPKAVCIERFFLRYRDGKCTIQVIGKNKIAQMPKEIAKFLNLPESETYTGHSLRGTSKFWASTGAANDAHNKRKSSAVAEGDVQESSEPKTKIGTFSAEAVNLASMSNFIIASERHENLSRRTATATMMSSELSSLVKEEIIGESLTRGYTMSLTQGTATAIPVNQDHSVKVKNKNTIFQLSNCSIIR